jgi:hypothetical protein
MYLVEIEAGREQLYQTVEAFAAAIRSGVIGPDSRIFHRASSSWISITLHPEYRKAMAARRAEPLPPLSRNQWTFFGSEPATREIIETAQVVESQSEGVEPATTPRGLRALFGRRRRAPSSSPDQTDQSGS